MSNIFENKGAFGATIVVAASDSLKSRSANYVCDGVDDQVEIQAAIDALPVIQGIYKLGKVVLLEGHFYINGRISIASPNDGLILEGMGHGTTVLGATELFEVNGANLAQVIDVDRSNVCIRDLCINGNKANNPTGGVGIQVSGHDCSIENVAIQYCKTDGLYIAPTSYAGYYKNVFSEFNDRHGFYVTGFLNTFVDLVTHSNGDHAYNLLGGDCYQNTFLGCLSTLDLEWGWNIGLADMNTLIGCMVVSPQQYGFVLSGATRNAFYGCQVLNPGQAANNTYDGFLVSASDDIPSTRNLLTNCVVRYISDDVQTYRYGFAVGGTVANNYNQFVGCVSEDAVTADFSVINIENTGNLIKNCLGNSFVDNGTATIMVDNKNVPVTFEKKFFYMTNNTGGNLVAGDVVSFAAVAAGDEIATPVGIGEDLVFGMLAENIDDAASGYVQVLGKTTILKGTNAGGAIAVGDFLCTEVGNRARLAAAGDMAFAISLEICGVDDLPLDALLIVPRKI